MKNRPGSDLTTLQKYLGSLPASSQKCFGSIFVSFGRRFKPPVSFFIKELCTSADCVRRKSHQRDGPLRINSMETDGGERGIRTPGTLLRYTRFPGVPVKPLLHLSFS